jgi:putative ABC transport system permease protein
MTERLARLRDWFRHETRDGRSLPWLDPVRQDLRYALRTLRRSPGFTIAVMLTLGLGIGANAAMFGVIDGLMYRPFPYMRDPATVNRVYLRTSVNGSVRTNFSFPYARYVDLRRSATSVARWAAISQWQLAIGTGEAARERPVVGVSAEFFAFFDAQPSLGRFFVGAEDQLPRGADVAVVSYDFWKSALGGADVRGQRLQVGPLVTTIVGVAPRGFAGVSEGEPPAVFIPITTLAYGVNQGHPETFPTLYNWDWTTVIVRRKPGVSEADASADLTNAYKRSRALQRASLNPNLLADSLAHPVAIAGAVRTAAGPAAGLESKTLLWVSGVAVIVLLIACANVANLMFARVLRRQREIAVRLALGVSRTRLIGIFFAESLIVALLGGIAGIVMSQWIAGFVRQLLAHDTTSATFSADWRTCGVAVAIALVAGIATSVGPALLAVRGDLATSLRGGVRGGAYQHSRTRSALLVIQGALSVTLLVGAGLFVRSFDHARAMHLGWDPAPVLIVTPNYRGLTMDSAARDAFRRRLLAAAQSIPSVVAAARVNSLPFATNTWEFRVNGIDSVKRLGRFNYQATSSGYFATVGTRIVRGRGFDANDRAGAAPVVVVSQSMARALWPDRDPIGQCMFLDPIRNAGAPAAADVPTPCRMVVGVAEDAVQQSITDDERLMYYVPDEQPPHRPSNRIFLRMRGGNPSGHAEEVRRALQRIMPGQAYVAVSALEDIMDTQRRSWRLGATMFVAFGALALIVAAVGLYGVIAYNIAQRMHELSVRVALGARSGDIMRLVITQGVSFAAAGIASGLAVALLAGRWIQPLLFAESARDPVVLGSVSGVIGLVALLASAAPAMRAARADPTAALRSD